MILNIKQKFYEFVKGLGYNATDNGTYIDLFPWLMIKVADATRQESHDMTTGTVKLTLDIFSTYNGEKEILEIVDNIGDNLHLFREENSEIICVIQQSCVIIGDNTNGPVKKHGIITYNILITEYNGKEDEDGEQQND